MSAPHEHVWDQTQDETQLDHANGLEAAIVTRHDACSCGEIRPTKRGAPRPPFQRTRQTRNRVTIARTPHNIVVAKSILAYDDTLVPWRGRRSALIKTITDHELENALQELAAAQLVRIQDRFEAGSWQIHQVEVQNAPRLEDHVEPGRRERIEAATRQALAELPQTPPGNKLRAFLEAGAPRWEPETITWAAAAVSHGASGKTSLIRQFSSQHALSKDFESHRTRIETILDLEELGLRDYPTQLLIGGHGLLRFPDAEIHVTPKWGAMGIDRERLRQASLVKGQRIVFIENRTVFHAAAAGLVEALAGSLIIFSGGTVGSTAEHLAKVSQGELFGWMDLDPEGVQMIRALHAASDGRLEPLWMGPEELRLADKDLPGGWRAAMLSFELQRGGILQDLLEEIKHTGKWLEQERQLNQARLTLHRKVPEAAPSY